MSDLRVTLLGFVLPEDEFQELLDADLGLPVQTQRFGLSLVRAMQEGGATVSLVSSSPATTYPHNRNWRFKGRRISIHHATGLELGFINLPVLKHITRAFGVFLLGPGELKATGSNVLVIHGVHSPWLAFGAFANRRLGVTSVAVLTDPPNVPHQFDNQLSRVLKRIDERVVASLLSRLDGVIALTRDLAEDFAPGIPYMVMEGIAPDLAGEQQPVARDGDPSIVLYAGGLSEEYGVQMLLDAHAMDPEAFRLQIAGRGPMEQVVRDRSAIQKNLQFLGLVAPADLPNLYASADVLVNPRPVDQGFTRYSFPSKVLEYMSSGKPVVSTRLEGIPEEYGDYLLFTQGSARGLRAAILSVLEQSTLQREGIGRRGRAFVMESKSSWAQGRRLVRFLSNCGQARATRDSGRRLWVP